MFESLDRRSGSVGCQQLERNINIYSFLISYKAFRQGRNESTWRLDEKTI
jgi:hypothetical protein